MRFPAGLIGNIDAARASFSTSNPAAEPSKAASGKQPLRQQAGATIQSGAEPMGAALGGHPLQDRTICGDQGPRVSSPKPGKTVRAKPAPRRSTPAVWAPGRMGLPLDESPRTRDSLADLLEQ